MRASLSALAVAVVTLTPLCVLAQEGQTAQPRLPVGLAEPEAAAGALKQDPRERIEEFRRERQGRREWITVPEVYRETLLGMLRDPTLALLDVTCKERGAKIAEQIPGAVWRDCTQVEQWAPEYRKDQTIVVYCA